MKKKYYKTMRTYTLKKFGFTITKEANGYNLQQYTPEGEDWNIYLSKLEDIKEYAEDFDPEEEFRVWFEAKQNSVQGVPGVAALWQDQLWKADLLKQILNTIQF